MKVCKPRNLTVLAYAGGFTLWHYRAPEGHLALDLINGHYFNSQHDMLRPGDLVYVTVAGPIDTYTKPCCVTSVDKEQKQVTVSVIHW